MALADIKTSWNGEINNIIHEREENYKDISVVVSAEAAQNIKTSFLRIIMTMKVSLADAAEVPDEKTAAMLEEMFHLCYSYSLEESEPYYCNGCYTEFDYCAGCKYDTAYCGGCVLVSPEPDGDTILGETTEEQVLNEETSGNDETNEDDSSDVPEEGSKMTCPGHSVFICPGHPLNLCRGGHKDLKVFIDAVPADEFYELAKEYFNSNSESEAYFVYGEFGQLEMEIIELSINEDLSDDMYQGLELFEDMKIFQ
jgi:hypothetical protein